MQRILISLAELEALVSAALVLSADGFAERAAFGWPLRKITIRLDTHEGGRLYVPTFNGPLQDLLWLFESYCEIHPLPKPASKQGSGSAPTAQLEIDFTVPIKASAHETIAATRLLTEALTRIGLEPERIADLLIPSDHI